jgi:hypothetical protein
MLRARYFIAINFVNFISKWKPEMRNKTSVHKLYLEFCSCLCEDTEEIPKIN